MDQSIYRSFTFMYKIKTLGNGKDCQLKILSQYTLSKKNKQMTGLKKI